MRSSTPGRWRRYLVRTSSDARKTPPRVLELRVHGVHNTPPQSMLGVTAGEIGQVAGDGLTGIFRTKDGKIPLRELTGNTAVEAYSWGALTSSIGGLLGWVQRVCWLFLLPFALLNLAYWARPELGFRTEHQASMVKNLPDAGIVRLEELASRQRKAARRGARLLRVAGLLLTAFMVLTPLTIGVDLVAWQCYSGGAAGCPALPGAFDFLAGEHADSASRRLALGSLPALLVIVVLWFLSRQSLARYEEVQEPSQLTVSDSDYLVLRHPRLWSGTVRTKRLQQLHITFALCVVICYTGVPALLTGSHPFQKSWWSQTEHLRLGAVDGVAIALGLIMLIKVILIQRDDIESGTTREASATGAVERHLSRQVLWWFVVALVVLHFSELWFLKFPELDDTTQTLRGENVWFIAIFVALTCLHIATFLVGRAPGWVTATAGFIVLALAALSSTWLTADDRPWASKLPGGSWAHVPAVGISLVCAGVLVLGIWHYCIYPRKHRTVQRTAWSGAAPSLLLASAIWVALLFTTLLVTWSADYLNGSDRSVGDLRTAVDPETDDNSSDDHPTLVAVGHVVVHDANIRVVKGGNVTVRLGSVKVDSFHKDRKDDEAIDLPDRDLTGDTLSFPPKTRLRYVNSCLYRVDGEQSEPLKGIANGKPIPCTGLTATMKAHSGTLPPLKKAHFLVVGAPDRPVGISSTHPEQTTLTLPQVLVWAPLGQLLWAIAAGLVALVCWLLLRRRRVASAVRDGVSADGNVPTEDVESCYEARLTAAFPHRGEQLLNLIGCVTAAISVGLVVGSLTGRPPWDVDGLGWTDKVATAALWVSLFSALGLVWLASRVRSSESTRKGVGILWDLTTFWPRAVHPLAPPCYAERVVPELLTRIKWALRKHDPDGGGADLVILSGHSQGSTLLVAAASRLSDNDLKKVRLITYGSQLRTWYGRVFPAVFGPAALGCVPTKRAATFGSAWPDAPTEATPVPSTHFPGYTPVLQAALCQHPGSLLHRLSKKHEQPRWVNLFRRTDPIGFRVFSDLDHPGQDTYVLEVPTRADGDPGPTVMTHGGYPHTVEYRETVAAWTGEQLPPVSKPRIAKPPFHPQS
jgi:hypothetical protein